MKSIAATAGNHWAGAVFGLFFVGLLGACSALPDKPLRSALYDFGPGQANVQTASPSGAPAPLPAVALADISTPGGALDNTAVLYRLAYLDAQQLRPYAQARWAMPPAQLVRQRLKERLSLSRAVFNAKDGLALSRSASAQLPPELRFELEEFSQLFSAPTASVGLIRLRATLVNIAPGGEQLLAQRSFVVQRPADSSDAPSGVRALTLATDAAIAEIEVWLAQSAIK
jgi:cholesterol transport system auxiliary component